MHALSGLSGGEWRLRHAEDQVSEAVHHRHALEATGEFDGRQADPFRER